MLVPAVAVVVVTADQLAKSVVRGTLGLGESIPVVGRAFRLTHVRNTGAAFGLFPEQQGLFIAATTAVIGVVLYLVVRGRSGDARQQVALGFLLGGAVGNLIDRIVMGRVTDFLDFGIWPVFNLADSAIVFGALLVVFSLLWRPETSPGEPGPVSRDG